MQTHIPSFHGSQSVPPGPKPSPPWYRSSSHSRGCCTPWRSRSPWETAWAGCAQAARRLFPSAALAHDPCGDLNMQINICKEACIHYSHLHTYMTHKCIIHHTHFVIHHTHTPLIPRQTLMVEKERGLGWVGQVVNLVYWVRHGADLGKQLFHFLTWGDYGDYVETGICMPALFMKKQVQSTYRDNVSKSIFVIHREPIRSLHTLTWRQNHFTYYICRQVFQVHLVFKSTFRSRSISFPRWQCCIVLRKNKKEVKAVCERSREKS